MINFIIHVKISVVNNIFILPYLCFENFALKNGSGPMGRGICDFFYKIFLKFVNIYN